MKGAFITIDGGDATGKTTQINFVLNYLQTHRLQVVNTREPGGTVLGEALRKILLTSDEAICQTAELLAFFAARAQHIDQVIVPALNAGKWVVCDRFTDATYAYQGGGRGIDCQHIETLEQLTQGKLQPDLTILLDAPPDVSQTRVLQTDLIQGGQQSTITRSETDRFEQQNQEFKQAVRAAYLRRAESFPQRIKVVNADQPIEQVSEAVQLLLDTLLRDKAA